MIIEKKIPYLIIGAGPTGLSAGKTLKDNGSNFLILEKENHPGGLAYFFGSKQHYDLGSHVFFTKDQKVLDFLVSIGVFSDLQQFKREAYFQYRNKFVRFPIQYFLKDFPIDVIIKVIIDKLKFKKVNQIESFKDYLVNTLGEYFFEHIFLPYLKKVWAVNPDELGVHWFNNRVANINILKIIKSFIYDYDWGPNNIYYYPKRRFFDIFENLSFMLPIKYGVKISSIDINNKIVRVLDPSLNIIDYKYDYLISTMPLDDLLKIINRDIPKELIYNSLYIVGLTFKGKIKKNFSWLYFSDKTEFFRTMNLSYSSDSEGYIKCILERSYLKNPPKIEDIYKDLYFIYDIEEIINFSDYHLKYAYPIPVKNLPKVVDPILEDLLKYNIISVGRFGTWKYEIGNTDHSIKQGINAALYCLGNDVKIWRV